MDTKEYISSGIIEIYVLGLATEEESEVLLKLCDSFPEIKEALISTQQGLEGYIDVLAVPPPAELKEKITKKIFLSHNTSATTVTPLALPADTTLNSKPASLNNANPIQWKWLAAASIVFLILSIGGNIYLYLQNSSYQATIASIEENNKRLAVENQTYLTNLQTTKDDLAVVMTPEAKQIPLNGVATHETAKAVIFWNKYTREVYLSITNLPAAPAGKQYQLWAIVDGTPVDAGVYDANDPAALHKMKQIVNAQMFAITLEKAGGVAAPTLTEMYVAGKV